MSSLRDAVRAEATERTWSQGVTLARDKRVTSRKKNGSELEFEVRVPGRPTPFEVVLDTGTDEWQCTCTSKEPVCSHVVAAVLAHEQGGGEVQATSAAMATVRYLLEPEDGRDSVALLTHTDGPQRVVRRVQHKDGHLVWIELDLVPDVAAGMVYAIGRDVSDRDTLVEIATGVGLDVERARQILDSDEFANEVRIAEQFFVQAGISGVPAVIIERKHLISGGQPPEVFERALRETAASKRDAE